MTRPRVKNVGDLVQEATPAHASGLPTSAG